MGRAVNDLARGVNGLPSDNPLLQINHDQGSGGVKFGKRHAFFLVFSFTKSCRERLAASLRMFPCKSQARSHADCRDANEENQECQIVTARGLSEAEQAVANEQIKQRPENIDCGRRQSLSRRVSEWRWKTVTRNTMHKVRHDVGEKHSGKEACDVASPVQGDFPFVCSVRARLC